MPSMSNEIWVFNKDGGTNQLSISEPDFSAISSTILKSLYTHAIWIRGLENYSEQIRQSCIDIGAVNCHAILGPANATILKPHIDQWDVLLYMLYGSRTYRVAEKYITIKKGEHLLIPKGIEHEVFCTKDSATMNYGIDPTSELKIEDLKKNLDITSGLYNYHDFFINWRE